MSPLATPPVTPCKAAAATAAPQPNRAPGTMAGTSPAVRAELSVKGAQTAPVLLEEAVRAETSVKAAQTMSEPLEEQPSCL